MSFAINWSRNERAKWFGTIRTEESFLGSSEKALSNSSGRTSKELFFLFFALGLCGSVNAAACG